MKTTFLFAALYLIIVCSCTNRNSTNDTTYYSINLEESIKNEQSFKLSEIADTLEYIVLKTPPDIIITSIRKIIRTDNYIFVAAKGVAYQFDSKGEFIRQIGGIGKGPGEYPVLADIEVDKIQNKILILTIPQLLYYDINGEFLESHDLFATSLAIQDSVLWASRINTGASKYKLVGLNKELDTIRFLPNFDFYVPNNYIVTSKSYYPNYYFNSGFYFKGDQDNDTIWKVRNTGFSIYAVIDMGKFKLPDKYRPSVDYQLFNKNAFNYYSVPYVAEDDHYLFLYVSPWIYEELPVLNIIYDKQELQGIVCRDDKENGFKDDILGGPNFWPRYIDNEYYINFIEAFELLESTDSDKKKSENFKTLLSEIDENSSQLLVFARKRK